MWLTGERRRALLYVVAYAAIGLFWASYWQIILAGAGAAQDKASAMGLASLMAHVVSLVADFSADAPLTMAANIARFIAWQNSALIPLAVAAWPAIREGEGIARAACGRDRADDHRHVHPAALARPWLGYRYLHGLIGVFAYSPVMAGLASAAMNGAGSSWPPQRLSPWL